MQCQGQVLNPTGHALGGVGWENLGKACRAQPVPPLPPAVSIDALKTGPCPSGREMAREGLQTNQKKQLLTGKAAHSSPALAGPPGPWVVLGLCISLKTKRKVQGSSAVP